MSEKWNYLDQDAIEDTALMFYTPDPNNNWVHWGVEATNQYPTFNNNWPMGVLIESELIQMNWLARLTKSFGLKMAGDENTVTTPTHKVRSVCHRAV